MISPLTKRDEQARKSFNLGLASISAGDYDQALFHLFRARHLNTGLDPSLRDYRIIYHIHRAFKGKGDYTAAIRHFAHFIGLFPSKAFSFYEIGVRLLNRFMASGEKNILRKSNWWIGQSILHDSKDPDSWYYHGYTSLMMGNARRARQSFKMVLQLEPDYPNQHAIEIFEKIRR